MGVSDKRHPKKEKEDKEQEEEEELVKENGEEHYDWNIVPETFPDDKKIGVTFKGETEEYIEATKKIFDMMNKKRKKYIVNEREIRILDNFESKPIKIEIKPRKGPSGKVNLKIFGVNKQGIATMMIQKMSGGNMMHVKAFAFKVIKYLIDGIIDGEIGDGDIENMECSEKLNKKDNLQCVLCKKILKSKQGLKIHTTKQHKDKTSIVCLHCNSSFNNQELLDMHIGKCNGAKESCEICTQAFEDKSHLQIHMKTKHGIQNKFKCNVCDYLVKSEIDLKRHNRDKHDDKTCSTSPKPKKQKKSRKEEVMEIDDYPEDGEVLLTPTEDNISNDVEMATQERDNYQDDGLEKNDRKRKDREGEYDEKNQEYKVLKPHLRELPTAVRKLLGEKFVLFPVDGDGACGPRSFAAWIYEDPTLGPHLARNMNRLFLKHWDYWSNKFAYPFIRNVGCGKKVICENEKELFEFFLDSEEGAYMWRGHEDFTIIANAYQIRITIITIKGMHDKNPETKIIEPNPDFQKYSEVAPGTIKDMIILHEHNVHYSLIIPRDCRLAENGSLDLQRSENAEKVVKFSDEKANNESTKEVTIPEDSKLIAEDVDKQIEANIDRRFKRETNMGKSRRDESVVRKLFEHVETKTNISDETTKEELKLNVENVQKATGINTAKKHTCDIAIQKIDDTFEERITSLEKNMKLLFERCKALENENKVLIQRLKEDQQKQKEEEHMKIDDEYDEIQNEEEILIQQKKRGFKRVGPYVQSEPKSFENEFCCDVCGCVLESPGLLDAHVLGHKPKTVYSCLKCEEKFENKEELKSHIEAKHKDIVMNNIRQFNCLDCSFQGEKSLELRKHIMRTQHTPCGYTEKCYDCGKDFKSYFHLMTHRKEEHESNKTCRYFLKNSCLFDAKDCWYKHEKRKEEERKEHNCKSCEENFAEIGDLRKHIKRNHTNEVAKCRDFIKGKCNLNESCWFLHEETEKETKNQNGKSEDLEKEATESSFQKASDKTPPDQENILGEILKQMTIQMKNLEMITKLRS